MTARSACCAAAGFLAVSPVVACVGGPQPDSKEPASAVAPADLSPEKIVREAVRKMRDEVKSFRLQAEFRALHGSTVVTDKKVLNGIAARPNFYFEEYSKSLAGGPPRRLFSNGEVNRIQDQLNPKFWNKGEEFGNPDGGRALYNPYYTLGVLDRVAGTAALVDGAKGEAADREIRLKPSAKEFIRDLVATGFHQARDMNLDQSSVEILLVVRKADGLPRRLAVRARGPAKGADGREAEATFVAGVDIVAYDEPVEIDIPPRVRIDLGWQNLELPKPAEK